MSRPVNTKTPPTMMRKLGFKKKKTNPRFKIQLAKKRGVSDTTHTGQSRNVKTLENRRRGFFFFFVFLVFEACEQQTAVPLTHSKSTAPPRLLPAHNSADSPKPLSQTPHFFFLQKLPIPFGQGAYSSRHSLIKMRMKHARELFQIHSKATPPTAHHSQKEPWTLSAATKNKKQREEMTMDDKLGPPFLSVKSRPQINKPMEEQNKLSFLFASFKFSESRGLVACFCLSFQRPSTFLLIFFFFFVDFFVLVFFFSFFLSFLPSTVSCFE
jgi:hypothetical protein